MGHNIRYYGKLTVKNPLTNVEIALFKELQNDNRNYNRLYALKYKDGYFEFEGGEKIYPDQFYPAIEKYVKILKEGGNDLTENSHLVSSSEYGIDDEAVLLLYTEGYFIKKKITELVSNYVMGIDSTKTKDLELKKEEKNDDFFAEEEFKSFYDTTEEELNKFIQDVQSGKYK
jgi:hypothetical protein